MAVLAVMACANEEGLALEAMVLAESASAGKSSTLRFAAGMAGSYAFSSMYTGVIFDKNSPAAAVEVCLGFLLLFFGRDAADDGGREKLSDTSSPNTAKRFDMADDATHQSCLAQN